MNKRSTVMKALDLSFVDVETTGLTLYHEVIEIGMIKVSKDTLEVVEEWEIKIHPEHIENASPKALEINRYNERDWTGAVSKEEAFRIFSEKAAGTFLVGHNLAFDFFFIKKALDELGIESTFWYQGLDTVSMAYEALRDVPEIKSFTLGEVARYFGIDRTGAHEALVDAKMTHQVFVKLIELQKNG